MSEIICERIKTRQQLRNFNWNRWKYVDSWAAVKSIEKLESTAIRWCWWGQRSSKGKLSHIIIKYFVHILFFFALNCITQNTSRTYLIVVRQICEAIRYSQVRIVNKATMFLLATNLQRRRWTRATDDCEMLCVQRFVWTACNIRLCKAQKMRNEITSDRERAQPRLTCAESKLGCC